MTNTVSGGQENIPRAMLNTYRLREALSRVSIASRSEQDFRSDMEGGSDGEAFSQEELSQLCRLCEKGSRILNDRMSLLFSRL